MNILHKLSEKGFSISQDELVQIVQKYSIKEIAVFGSVLRDDFSDNSDIDLLITFFDDAEISLFDLIDLEHIFTGIFKRPVDIVEPAALKNPIRRKNILSSSEILYAA